MKKLYNIHKINRMRAIAGIISCSLMFAFTFTTLILNVAQYYSGVVEKGLKTFRMFTTLSNIVLGLSSLLFIPFQIDGLRKGNFHLPRWIVTVMYMSVSLVGLTFITAVTAISAVQGFYGAMVAGTGLFLHTINPILAIIIFTLVNDFHHIKFKESFWALLPVFIYSVFYFILAICIGEENGGWRDHYNFNTFLPWYISIFIMYGLAFGVSQGLRALHNLRHKKTKEAIKNYYLNSEDFNVKNLEEAVKVLAKQDKRYYREGNVEVPIIVFDTLRERFNDNTSNNVLGSTYINAILEE